MKATQQYLAELMVTPSMWSAHDQTTQQQMKDACKLGYAGEILGCSKFWSADEPS